MYTTNDGELNSTKLIKHVTLGLLTLVIAFGSFGVVGAGERGVKVRLGAVVGAVNQGLYFKLPLIEKVVKMNVRTQAVVYGKKKILLQELQKTSKMFNYQLW